MQHSRRDHELPQSFAAWLESRSVVYELRVYVGLFAANCITIGNLPTESMDNLFVDMVESVGGLYGTITF